jgi:hypothetical protein
MDGEMITPRVNVVLEATFSVFNHQVSIKNGVRAKGAT